jgi:hypothetical protein
MHVAILAGLDGDRVKNSRAAREPGARQ